jgi:glycosyltransferase involved in cell wall biosynthesis
MRVLYLSRGGNPHDRRFLSALATTDYEVYFLPMESNAAAERDFVPQNIEILEGSSELRRHGRSSGSHDKRSLRQVLDRIRPDLVHAGPIQCGAYLTAQVDWHPLVSMSWGSDLLVDAQQGEGRKKAEYALGKSDVLVCDCEAVREAAIDLGMQSERIVVFPWGVDLERFSPGDDGGLREQLGWEETFIVLSTRSWEPIYGVDVIVEAFILASRKVPSLRLVMLEEGSLKKGLVKELEDARLIHRILAPGSVELAKLPAFYRTADLYLSASHSDGSSVSLLEAMACGLPAIVSAIPGNREWVVPEKTGWWFEDGNADQLAGRLVDAMAGRKRLAEMGQRAREIANARADWMVNFDRLIEAYQMAVL